MTTKKYSDLSTNEILKLDGGDLDQAELASRLARRLGLERPDRES
jgi:hypothetical protein